MELNSRILSDLIIYSKYSRYIPSLKRRETWDEIIDRNKKMHLKKFPKLKEEIVKAYCFVYDKKVLPSMRSLQFAGKPIDRSPVRLYNCSYCAIDHPDIFSEIMFLLLSGCGVGYSVQLHHISELPDIVQPKKTRRFLVNDSLEGWADAVKVLISAYMGERKSLPVFDFSDIRDKGELLKTSGGRAPGPEPLKTCLHHIQTILDRKENGSQLSSLECHDIICHTADCVLSGGIRRSAMIALFSFHDNDMLGCKFGKWYEENPQRGRANNSAVILRHKIKEEEFYRFWKKIQQGRTGEPGIFWANDQNWGANPCVEIALRNHQFCNLVETNVSDVKSQEDFNQRVKVAAFIATLQASYTDFHYLREIWKETTEREALIGVSLTGIASGNILDYDMKEAANVVLAENSRVAEMIGINEAARCTTVKPSGTASLVLGCSSGIHPWHNDYYIRRVRINKEETIYRYLADNHPELIEDEYFKPHLESVVSIPIKAPEGSETRKETALHFLNRVEKVFKQWVKSGHRKGHHFNNVSATVSLKDHEWDRAGKWMWENKDSYTAIAVLPYEDHTHVQLPLEDINEDEYKKLSRKLKSIDLSKVKEEADSTSLPETLACAGGSCEIL